MAQLPSMYSWKLILPCVESAVKSCKHTAGEAQDQRGRQNLERHQFRRFTSPGASVGYWHTLRCRDPEVISACNNLITEP